GHEKARGGLGLSAEAGREVVVLRRGSRGRYGLFGGVSERGRHEARPPQRISQESDERKPGARKGSARVRTRAHAPGAGGIGRSRPRGRCGRLGPNTEVNSAYLNCATPYVCSQRSE